MRNKERFLHGAVSVNEDLAMIAVVQRGKEVDSLTEAWRSMKPVHVRFLPKASSLSTNRVVHEIHPSAPILAVQWEDCRRSKQIS